MTPTKRSHLRRAAAAAALALAATAAGPARADGVTARIEPGYQSTSSTTTSEGTTTTSDKSVVTQKYGLNADVSPWPLLHLYGGGLLDWTFGSVKSEAQSGDQDIKRWNGFGRFDLGGPAAKVGAGYERREDVTTFETTDLKTTSRLIRDLYSGYALVRPEALPSADLRVSHSHSYDGQKVLADQYLDEATLGLRYEPTPPVELRYSFRFANPRDELKGTDSLSLGHFARATYGGAPIPRLSLFSSYEISRQDTTTRITGPGGTVSTQQFPIRGFSALEIFPATPGRIALDQNPALIDGNTAATAGLDIGYRAGGAGVPPARELGVQFSDAITPVNELHVWVDRRLPSDIWGAYTWTAWQSENNLEWQQIDPVGAVTFDLFENRFTIPIPETRARYLKVVVSPLPPTLSTDPQFATILVTELQTFLVESAQGKKGTVGSTRGSFNAGARYAFEGVPGLSYDLSTFLRHGTGLDHVLWSVTNGLSYTRRVTRTATFNARVDRTDFEETRGHEASTGYAASVSTAPLPTLQASVTVNGSVQQSADTTERRNSLVVGGTADLYRGVAVSANGSATLANDSAGRSVRSTDVRASASIVPHRSFTLSTTFAATDSRTSGGGAAPSTDSTARLESSASFSPVPALLLTGSHTRYLWGTLAPATISSFGVIASPFSGGALLLRFSYQESVDTSQELRTKTWGPGLRWNIRTRWFLDVTYTRNENRAPALENTTDAFMANLLAIIG